MLISWGERVPRNCSHSSLQQLIHKSQTPDPTRLSWAGAWSALTFRLSILLGLLPFSSKVTAQLDSCVPLLRAIRCQAFAGCMSILSSHHRSKLQLPLPVFPPCPLQSLELKLVWYSRQKKGSRGISPAVQRPEAGGSLCLPFPMRLGWAAVFLQTQSSTSSRYLWFRSRGASMRETVPITHNCPTLTRVPVCGSCLWRRCFSESVIRKHLSLLGCWHEMGWAWRQPRSRPQIQTSQISAGLDLTQVPGKKDELDSSSLPPAKYRPLQEPCFGALLYLCFPASARRAWVPSWWAISSN